MTYTPTPEQIQAVKLFATGSDLAIQAGAGAGKTSTLVMLAEHARRANRRGQYTAFNKAIVTDGEKRFPVNVACNTAHSLAFRAVAKPYAARLRSSRMRSEQIAGMLRVEPFTITYGAQHKRLAAGWVAGHVMATVGRFCQSADLELAARHVPYVDGIDVPSGDGQRTYANNNDLAAHIIPYARRAWADLTDTTGQLPFKHDHYLKMWQLSAPKLPVDFILVDECQDLNPVLADIVLGQDHAQRVFVGDQAQSIYGFTGAIDVFERLPQGTNEAFLSQSFRFGPAVADVANGLLGRLGARLRLTGFDRIASTVGEHDQPAAILTRTNGRAVAVMFEQIAAGRRPHLVGGGAQVVSFARAALDLQNGIRTTHPELACFETWGEVQEYVDSDSQGIELRMLVKLIDDYGAGPVVNALDGMASESQADVIVSTAHKAKGREWDVVALADDFPAPDDGTEISPEELRLGYVAVTRAKKHLDPTATPHLLAVPAGAGK